MPSDPIHDGDICPKKVEAIEAQNGIELAFSKWQRLCGIQSQGNDATPVPAFVNFVGIVSWIAP